MSVISSTMSPGTDPRADKEPANHSPDRMRVYLMDLWCFIPYYMARLCASLREQGVDAKLASVRFHLDRNYFRTVGLSPDRCLLDVGGNFSNTFLRRMAKSLEYMLNLCFLGLRVLKSEPTIVHVQYLPFLNRGFPFEIWFLRWVRYRGARVVHTVHNVTDQDAPDRHKSLYARAYCMADVLVCHGKEASAELVRSFGVPADKIQVIPHGPLFEKRPAGSQQEARANLALPPSEPLVLCFGAIRQYKGIPFLLDAWKGFIESGGKGRLLIAGTGDSRFLSLISEKVFANGLKSTVDLWLHYVPVDQLPLLHQAADVLVYPYKAVTTSGALLTGLNYGKAVIATNLPFFREYLRDDENALLVDYGDTNRLAFSLRVLLERPEERFRIAIALQNQHAQRVSWREISKATRECYENLLQGRPLKDQHF
jgi:glycosyltransferase involved in cell wall biosynthesis